MNNYVNVKKMSITLSKDMVNELNKFAEEMNEKKSHIIEKALCHFGCGKFILDSKNKSD